MNKVKTIKAGYAGGILFIAFFLICSVWGVMLGTPELKELHFNILQMSLPGFSFTAIGYLIGLVESFIYGWLAGAFIVWICKKICVNGDK